MAAGRRISQLIKKSLQLQSSVRISFYLFLNLCSSFIVYIRATLRISFNFPFFKKRKSYQFCWQGPSSVSSFWLKHEEAVGSAGVNSLRALALLGAGASGLLSFASIASADEAEHGLSSPDYPWPHKGILSSYDHSS